MKKDLFVCKLNLFTAFLILIMPAIVLGQVKEKVRVALGSISVNTSVIPVGHQYGIFAKHEKEKGTF